ncbi:MAG: hypothetical protein RLZZ553_1167 [Verrucomicrobiota bacterium]|jgi:hypothetical protein
MIKRHKSFYRGDKLHFSKEYQLERFCEPMPREIHVSNACLDFIRGDYGTQLVIACATG